MPNNTFQNEERLFHRVKKLSVDSSGKIDPATIPFPNTSTNREKYSEPEDVLENVLMADYSVFFITVEDTDISTQTHGGNDMVATYHLKPIHDPLENNYSHTELRLFKNEGINNVDKNFRNKRVKIFFRRKLSDAFKLYQA